MYWNEQKTALQNKAYEPNDITEPHHILEKKTHKNKIKMKTSMYVL